ncbi:MAG: hypothetical protein JG769_1941 [Oscillospiraceae bacterium]|jgi:hypothetical protein|nr:hypothetical protein [Oscillospiraceae bacterium]
MLDKRNILMYNDFNIIKGSVLMDYEKERKKLLKSALPVMGAIFLVMASAAYILFRAMSDRAYYEKWKDYDECGLS